MTRRAAERALDACVPLALLLTTAGFMAVSIGWRPVHDLPLMIYIGSLMEHEGVIPYRGVFEMNPPGTHLLHQALVKLVGTSDLGWRAADLSWLLATQVAIFSFVRRWSWGAGVAAACIFSLEYLFGGARMSFQREYLIVLPLCLSLLLALRWPTGPLWLRAGLVGLLHGAAMSVKPPLVIALPVVLAGLLLTDRVGPRGRRRRSREWVGALASAALGLALVPALCAAYLLESGAWEAFREMSAEYWPLYSQLRGDASVRSNPLEARRFVALFAGARQSPFLPVFAIGLFLGLPQLWRRSAAARVEAGVLVALLFASLAYLFVSGKFWFYHAIPLHFVYGLFGGLAVLWARVRSGALAPSALRIALLAGVLLTAWQLPYQADRVLKSGRSRIPAEIERVAMLLRERMDPGDTVQPLDTTNGAIHAMLLAGAPLATPFFYQFQFYHHPDAAIIRRLRQRMLLAMESARPRFIVEAQSPTWRPHGPRTSDSFAELEVLIATDYAAVWSGRRLKLYERRSPREQAPGSPR